MQKEYRISPVQLPVHGLKDRDAPDVLSDPQGFELFVRDDIKLKSLGIYDSEKAAKDAARRHAKDATAIFV